MLHVVKNDILHMLIYVKIVLLWWHTAYTKELPYGTLF